MLITSPKLLPWSPLAAAGIRLNIEEEYNNLITGDTANFDFVFINKNGVTGGRVETCINGSYVNLCSGSWSNRDASLVCERLGFSPYGKTCIIVHPTVDFSKSLQEPSL